MNRRTIILAVGGAAVAVFGLAVLLKPAPKAPPPRTAIAPPTDILVRAHAPTLGPVKAAVTIVEFFDPACESCRAFYPTVKQILAKYPQDVRLVLRYTPLHKGSDEAAKIMEAARLQYKFVAIKEALLDKQPLWADHARPKIALAWDAAKEAGLDIERARKDILNPTMDQILKQDMADAQAARIRGTPTFFVNGKPLPTFGVRQLVDLVDSEVAAARGRK